MRVCEICGKKLIYWYQKRCCSVSCRNRAHSADMKIFFNSERGRELARKGGCIKGKMQPIEKGRKISRAKKGVPLSEKNKEGLRRAWNYDKHRKSWENTGSPPPQNKLEKKLERMLNQFFPESWKFVGDGQVWIGHRCPDFINVNGRKQLIELFGNHWHQTEDEDRRVKHFAKYGFDTLVIWENELSDRESLIEKIKDFTV